MSRSTDQIEREVEMTRANVEETVEALKDKMTVGEIFDEASHYLRSTELMSNLGAQARANPIPLVLIGVGLAWLMSGRGQPAMHLPSWHGRRGDEGDYYDDVDEDLFGYETAGAARASGRAYTRYGGDGQRAAGFARQGGYDSGGTSRSYGAARQPSLAERASGALEGVGETAGDIAGGVRSAAGSAAAAASRVGETVSSTASNVAGGVSSAASNLAGGVSSAASTVSGAAASAADALSGGARYAADTAGSAAHYVGETAAEAYARTRRGAYRASRRARSTFYDVLEQEPLVLGALGLAVGAAIGAMLPATEVEDRYLGETRDRLRREAEEAARALAEKGKEVAEDAYESARSEFASSGDAATVAEKVERVAKAAAGTVKEEVQGLVGGTAPSSPGGGSPSGGSRTAGTAAPSSGATTTGGMPPRKS